MFPNFLNFTTGLTDEIKTYMADNYTPLGGSISPSIGNALFVATTGKDTNDGSIVKPFLTIQKAIDTATTGTTIYIFSGTYTENLTLKDGIMLVGASKYQTIVKGITNVGTVSSTSYLNNLLLQGNTDVTIGFVGTSTEKETLYINNCILESANGTNIIDYLNENQYSELRIKDSILNVHSSTSAKCIQAQATSKGNIFVENSEFNLLDNKDNISIQLYGTVNYSQNGGSINGQVIIENTSLATLSYLNISTYTVPCLITNSTNISSLTNVIASTNDQFFATGTGNFYYANVITDRQASNMLNAGTGAIPYVTNGLLLNTTSFATNELIATGNINGLIETDGVNLYCILDNTRKNVMDYLNLENKPSIPTNMSNLTNDSKYIKTTNLVQGNNITLTVDDNTNNITISSTASGGTGTDEKVKMSSTSTTADYLDQLIDNTTITVVNEKLVATGKGNFSEMNDVDSVNPTDVQVIGFNTSTNKYVNKNFTDMASALKYPNLDNFKVGSNITITKGANNDLTFSASVDTSGLVTDSEFTSGLSGKSDTNHTHAYTNITGTPDLGLYVQKDGAKVLSDNNYSSADKTKVDTIITTGDGTKYKTDDGTYREIVLPTSSGGNSSNMYFLDRVSTADSNFKGLSYIPSTTEVLKSITVNNNELLLGQYLFDTQVGISTINSGMYRYIFHGYSSSSTGTNKLRIVTFMRSEAGVEQDLFSVYSDNIVNLSSQEIKIEIVKGIFSIVNTDHIGFKIYASTTNTTDTTLTIKIGGDESAYLNTPLALRHDSLRALNSDINYQHLTQTQKDQLHTHPNQTIIDKFAETAQGLPTYNGTVIGSNIDGTSFMKTSEYNTSGTTGVVDTAKTLYEGATAEPLTTYGKNSQGQLGFYHYPIVVPTTSLLTQRILYNLQKDVAKTIDFNNTNPSHQLIVQCWEEIQESAVTEAVDDYTSVASTTHNTDNILVDSTGTSIKDSYTYNLAGISDLFGCTVKETNLITLADFAILDTIA